MIGTLATVALVLALGPAVTTEPAPPPSAPAPAPAELAPAPAPGPPVDAPPPTEATLPSVDSPAETPPTETPPSATTPPTEAAPPPVATETPSSTEPPPPEPETLGELVDPAATDEPVAVEPAAETIPPPAPTTATPVPAPTRTGKGMLVAAGVLGSIGGIIKIGTTVAIMQAIGRGEPYSPMATLGSGAFFYDPLIVTSLGLAAGGMARRGRIDAHAALFEGVEPRRARRFGLGWGLLGGGVSVWVITRVVGSVSCSTEACTARIWEAGYYTSLLGTVPGAIMAGYATGYRGYERRYGKLAGLGVAPIARRDAVGLSLSGRF